MTANDVAIKVSSKAIKIEAKLEQFRVDMGIRLGCMMTAWLFNIVIDGVVREMNSRVMEKGVALVSDNDREWQLNQILYAHDTALLADNESKLQSLVTEFGNVCERRKLSECCEEQGNESNEEGECGQS
jgi:hypothetical protein